MMSPTTTTQFNAQKDLALSVAHCIAEENAPATEDYTKDTGEQLVGDKTKYINP